MGELRSIHLLYDSRSGSTLLSRLIKETFDVFVTPEFNFLFYVMRRRWPYLTRMELMYYINRDRKFDDLKMDKDVFISKFPLLIDVSLFCHELDVRFFENFGKDVIVYKKGNNLFVAKQLIQHSKSLSGFVGIIRDGRGVFNSKRNSIYSLTNEPFEVNPTLAAKKWLDYNQELLGLHESYPDKVILLRYEDLVKDSNAELNRIKDFFKLNVSPTKVTYTVSDRYGQIHSNIQKDPDKDIMQKWQTELSKEEIVQFQEIAGSLLKKLDYPIL